MIRHRIWKSCLGILLLLAIMCLVMQPVFAEGKSKSDKKNKGDVVTSISNTAPENQDSIEGILAKSSGPPIDNPGEGLYYKVVPGNGKILVKYFKNGHKENQSGWIYCPDGVCPYGQ